MPGTWGLQAYNYSFCNDEKCTSVTDPNSRGTGISVSLFGSNKSCFPYEINKEMANLYMSTSVSEKKNPPSGPLKFLDWLNNKNNNKFIYSTSDNIYNSINDCIGNGVGHSGDNVKPTISCPDIDTTSYNNVGASFEQIQTSNDYYRVCKRATNNSAESCCKNQIGVEQINSCPDDIYNIATPQNGNGGRSLGCRKWMQNYCTGSKIRDPNDSCRQDYCNMEQTLNPCRDAIINYCNPDNMIFGGECSSIYSETKDETLKNSLVNARMKYCQADPNRIVQDKNCRNFCSDDKFIQNKNAKNTCDSLTKTYCSNHNTDKTPLLDDATISAMSYCSCVYPLVDLAPYPGMTVECHEPTCNSVGYKTQKQIDNSTHCPSCLSVINTGNVSASDGGSINIKQEMTCGSNGKVESIPNVTVPQGYTNLKILSNKDNVGQTIDSYTSVSNAQSCIDKCANNINCNGVAYHSADKTCWTLKDASNTKDALGSIIYTMDKISDPTITTKSTDTATVNNDTTDNNFLIFLIFFIIIASILGYKFIFMSPSESKHHHPHNKK